MSKFATPVIAAVCNHNSGLMDPLSFNGVTGRAHRFVQQLLFLHQTKSRGHGAENLWIMIWRCTALPEVIVGQHHEGSPFPERHKFQLITVNSLRILTCPLTSMSIA